MARYVSHEEKILDAAVEALFPLPPRPNPVFIAGVLAGFTRALDAIDSSITVTPDTTAALDGAADAFQDAKAVSTS